MQKIIDRPRVGFGDSEWEEIVRGLAAQHPELIGDVVLRNVTPDSANRNDRLWESGSAMRNQYLAPPLGHFALTSADFPIQHN